MLDRFDLRHAGAGRTSCARWLAGAGLVLALQGCGQTIQAPVTAPANRPEIYHGHADAQTITCSDQPVVVKGSDSALTIDHLCAGLTVTGSHDIITVSLRPRATILVTGSGNEIRWHVAGGGSGGDQQSRPTVVDRGTGNSIHQIADVLSAP